MKIIYFSETENSLDFLKEFFSMNNDKVVFVSQVDKAVELFFANESDIVIYEYFSENSSFQKDCMKLFEQLMNSNRNYIPCFFIDCYSRENVYKLYLKTIPLLLKPPENDKEAESIYKIISRFYLKNYQKISYCHLIDERKEMIIENEFDIIQNVIQQMTVNLPIISRNPKKIEFALYEVLVNAIEHGNLAITATEKKESIMNNTYYELLQKRKNNPEYQKKRVHIKIHLTKDFAEYIIKDEGAGFNWRKKFKDRKNFDLLNEHGRGIMMIENFFDIVDYNEKGNMVRLVKYSEYYNED